MNEPQDHLFFAAARAVMELMMLRRTDSLRLPYPPLVQLTLDRIVLDCLRRGDDPPTSVPDLVARLGDPARWPFVPPVGITIPLVDLATRTPTRTCAEAASAGPSGVLEQEAELLLAEIAEGCRSAEHFAECRAFLSENIIISPARGRALSSHRRKSALLRRLRWLYEEAPTAFATRGMGERFLAECARCRFPAFQVGRAEEETWRCETGYCGLMDAPTLYGFHDSLLLRAPLRLFMALPGQVESDLLRRLHGAGVSTVLVEGGLGAHRTTHPVDGPVFQVFDREDPVLLAARFSELDDLPGPPVTAVIPDRVVAERPSYLTTLAAHLEPGKTATVVTEAELLRSLIGAVEEGLAHA
ncbi:pPIWI_RE_Y domain-containing protein [Streptosporangium saharense]|uniref:pPIWI-RE three-gene island domain-containing protein n=1 Tax=Streptosporangium saharense TaxID=1706840 RepID=A0A7W7VKH1_9ACTN|nr:hypothetical protein [Streptosporangium saharense]MBB4913080.1 hypothetical protein [Streptosporangium saharense]